MDMDITSTYFIRVSVYGWVKRPYLGMNIKVRGILKNLKSLGSTQASTRSLTTLSSRDSVLGGSGFFKGTPQASEVLGAVRLLRGYIEGLALQLWLASEHLISIESTFPHVVFHVKAME
ncbi:hypothetical protein KY289_013541 [Solanum tuberosum]|nr:hypothetical protein KY289_013541 [Solanum tuberosum]